MADEKTSSAKTAGSDIPIPSESSKLKKIKDTVTEPTQLKKWYLDYVLSDFTFASVYVAILLTLKVALNLDWTRFFSGLSLFYVVFIGILASKAFKTVCNYYDKKAKLMELIAKSNDLRNVRL